MMLSVPLLFFFAAAPFPVPAVDPPTTTHTATAVLSGGCFWGVEAVFERLHGVTGVVSGYAGGKAATAHYEMVGSGRTGHAGNGDRPSHRRTFPRCRYRAGWSGDRRAAPARGRAVGAH